MDRKPNVLVASAGRCGTLNIAKTLYDIGECVIHSQIPVPITLEKGYCYNRIRQNKELRRILVKDYLELYPDKKMISIHGSDSEHIMTQKPPIFVEQILKNELDFSVLTRNPINQVNSLTHKEIADQSSKSLFIPDNITPLCCPGGIIDQYIEKSSPEISKNFQQFKKLYTYDSDSNLVASPEDIEILNFFYVCHRIFLFNAHFYSFWEFLNQKGHKLKIFHYEDVFHTHETFTNYIWELTSQKHDANKILEGFNNRFNSPSHSNDSHEVFENWSNYRKNTFIIFLSIYLSTVPERYNHELKEVTKIPVSG